MGDVDIQLQLNFPWSVHLASCCQGQPLESNVSLCADSVGALIRILTALTNICRSQWLDMAKVLLAHIAGQCDGWKRGVIGFMHSFRSPDCLQMAALPSFRTSKSATGSSDSSQPMLEGRELEEVSEARPQRGGYHFSPIPLARLITWPQSTAS